MKELMDYFENMRTITIPVKIKVQPDGNCDISCPFLDSDSEDGYCKLFGEGLFTDGGPAYERTVGCLSLDPEPVTTRLSGLSLKGKLLQYMTFKNTILLDLTGKTLIPFPMKNFILELPMDRRKAIWDALVGVVHMKRYKYRINLDAMFCPHCIYSILIHNGSCRGCPYSSEDVKCSKPDSRYRDVLRKLTNLPGAHDINSLCGNFNIAQRLVDKIIELDR